MFPSFWELTSLRTIFQKQTPINDQAKQSTGSNDVRKQESLTWNIEVRHVRKDVFCQRRHIANTYAHIVLQGTYTNYTLSVVVC